MNATLTEALRGLSLKPGEHRFVTVDGDQFEIRRSPASVVDEGPMITLDFTPPRSARAITVPTRRGPRILPDPIVIDENNLAPE